MMAVFVKPQHANIWWLFLLQGLAGIILGLHDCNRRILGLLLGHHGDTGAFCLRVDHRCVLILYSSTITRYRFHFERIRELDVLIAR
jgi:hypothetical protein